MCADDSRRASFAGSLASGPSRGGNMDRRASISLSVWTLILANMSTSQSSTSKPAAKNRQKNEARLADALKFFAALLAVSFVLRIFHSAHLFQDDGFWFTAGEEILRGKALYREVYFDKPPALPLVYGLSFWIFGAHIIVIRLLTIFYVVAVSAVLYCFGGRLYDRRTGMLAAAMFTFFSTISVNNHEQGFNTDLLMTLPYSASAYFFVRACFEARAGLALIGGILTALAAQANPKGVFALVFFSVLLIVARKWRAEGAGPRSFSLVLCSLLGFVAGTLPFLIYLLASRALPDYWLFVWDWGSRYAGYFSIWSIGGRALWLTATFFVRNNTLLFGFVFVAVVVFRSVAGRALPRNRAAQRNAGETGSRIASRVLRSDITLLIWFLVSYAALAAGGRFYSNYFIQILPGLCLIGGRGLIGIHSALKASSRTLRRAAIVLIAAGFIITLVRFHTRTASLAVDWLRGTRSAANANWYHERLNREERMVAAAVRDLSNTAGAASALDTEALRENSPRTHGDSDYLFIWGSRAEIYYWSGLLPASRYLSTQPLTGVPADVHHDSGSRPILDEPVTAAARAQLVADLEQTRPRYIVDELGFFNKELSIQSYPELRKLMADYESLGATGSFLIYRRRH